MDASNVSAGFSDKIVPVIPSVTLRVIVGTTCTLSALGSLLIIVSYCYFKSLRSAARLILVHLSVMDLGVALANLVGDSFNFSKYYVDGDYTASGYPLLKDPRALVHALCNVQAAFAVYCTMGSLLWTNCMAVYIYLRIAHHITSKTAHRTLLMLTACCYFFPVLFLVWKWPLSHRLGYSPFSSAGWCADKLIDTETGQLQVLMQFVGYDLWILLTYVMVPVLYASVYLHIRLELQQSSMFMSSEKLWEAVHSLDYKLLLVPLAFLLLRIWSLILSFVYFYLGLSLPKPAHVVLTYLEGIGDSGQGAVNAVLFVFFTKRARRKLLQCSIFRCCPAQLKSTSHSVDVTGNVQNYYHVPTEPGVSPGLLSQSSTANNSDSDSVY